MALRHLARYVAGRCAERKKIEGWERRKQAKMRGRGRGDKKKTTKAKRQAKERKKKTTMRKKRKNLANRNIRSSSSHGLTSDRWPANDGRRRARGIGDDHRIGATKGGRRESFLERG